MRRVFTAVAAALAIATLAGCGDSTPRAVPPNQATSTSSYATIHDVEAAVEVVWPTDPSIVSVVVLPEGTLVVVEVLHGKVSTGLQAVIDRSDGRIIVHSVTARPSLG